MGGPKEGAADRRDPPRHRFAAAPSHRGGTVFKHNFFTVHSYGCLFVNDAIIAYALANVAGCSSFCLLTMFKGRGMAEKRESSQRLMHGKR